MNPSLSVQQYMFFSELQVVSFDPTVYTVTEGVDDFVVLTLVRIGDISGATTITVTIESGSALGSHLHMNDLIFETPP